MNKKDLKERAGMSGSTIEKMTKGGFVSLEVLYRIAKELDVDFGDLINIVRDEKFQTLFTTLRADKLC